MKALYTLILIISWNISFSQVEFYPDFGAPSPDETAMIKCSFDPEAEAMYLRKDAIVLPDEDRRMISRHRVRIKIMKDNATSYGEIKIPFYHQNDYEVIEDIKAVVVNFTASGEKVSSFLSAKDIYKRKKDAYYSVVSFALPDVKKYSIIEYTYTSTRKSYRAIDYWYFQDELPVLKSHYEFTILPNSEFSYRVLHSPVYPVKMVHNKNLGKLIFDMNDLPAIREEPFMDSRNDYLQRVELQLASVGTGLERNRFVATWPEATRELLNDEDFGLAIDRNIPGTGDLVNTAKAITDEKKRMEFLFRQVINNISWDGYQGIYMAGKLKSIWTGKKGSVAEMNLLLINLLRSAGLQADPLLVSERWHGKVNTEQAFLTQFNKVIACVSLNEKNYFLDATNPQQVMELIPRNLLNTKAYLVNKKNSRFLYLADEDHMDIRTINFIGKILPDGSMHGQALLMDKDYARIYAVEALHEDKGAYVRNNYIEPYHAIQIDSFHVENEEYDSLPLNQDIRFSSALQQSGDYFMLPLHLFSGLGKNPFVSDQRSTHINFGCRKSITFNELFTLDKNFVVDALPKNISFIMPDTSIVFKRILEFSEAENRITTRITIDFNKAVYTADEYPMVYSFYKKLYTLLDEPILLKKTK